jgi:hypothetical protein
LEHQLLHLLAASLQITVPLQTTNDKLALLLAKIDDGMMPVHGVFRNHKDVIGRPPDRQLPRDVHFIGGKTG